MRTNDWPTNIREMHHKFRTKDWVDNADQDSKKELMRLRMRMLTEEFSETMDAYLQSDAEEMIDGLIDLCVIAIGTLDLADVDAHRAWREVFLANISKEVGVKDGRPNPLGLPDLIKTNNWESPDHTDNHGKLEQFI